MQARIVPVSVCHPLTRCLLYGRLRRCAPHIVLGRHTALQPLHMVKSLGQICISCFQGSRANLNHITVLCRTAVVGCARRLFATDRHHGWGSMKSDIDASTVAKGAAARPAPNPKDDLVEDRAITNAAADHFGHAQFASQAAATIRAIRTPSNIAVYAPWGSGKTSLANLLEGELAGDEVGFVYFDAFKYAEAPLRREFIRRVAKSLDVGDSKFDHGLYEERVDSGLNLSRDSAWGLVKVIVVVGALAMVLALGLSYLVALASGKAIGPQWVDAVKVFVPAFFAPAIIIAPLITLIGDKLNYTRTRFAPESDEEFERLFREVVDKARKKHPKWQRLVIFIDELDRCGADEVASTLETIRTFLEVEHCVFVVAADRAVLETAVGKESRQETPVNIPNPYYSAGSSYLDKIFQYQWQLPPMLPSNLSRFAESLVKDLPGLWSELNPGEVVSVLVPLHVQSPRRVKELLNAYAMAYRFAERRIADHHLDGDIRSRASELAKLVCLQLEFPLFAADLANEPSLPELSSNAR